MESIWLSTLETFLTVLMIPLGLVVGIMLLVFVVFFTAWAYMMATGRKEQWKDTKLQSKAARGTDSTGPR